jgi:hypothetical protein
LNLQDIQQFWGYTVPNHIITRGDHGRPTEERNKALEAALTQLRPTQAAALDDVLKRHAENSKTNSGQGFIIMGEAGTGKSHWVNVLDQAVRNRYSPSTSINTAAPPQPSSQHLPTQGVAKMAYTGTAAYQIRGSTLFQTLGLKPRDTQDQSPVARNKLKDIQGKLSSVEWFVIDEMSMLTTLLLYRINLALQQIFCNTKDFGGKTVILLGDLMQEILHNNNHHRLQCHVAHHIITITTTYPSPSISYHLSETPTPLCGSTSKRQTNEKTKNMTKDSNCTDAFSKWPTSSQRTCAKQVTLNSTNWFPVHAIAPQQKLISPRSSWNTSVSWKK